MAASGSVALIENTLLRLDQSFSDSGNSLTFIGIWLYKVCVHFYGKDELDSKTLWNTLSKSQD